MCVEMNKRFSRLWELFFYYFVCVMSHTQICREYCYKILKAIIQLDINRLKRKSLERIIKKIEFRNKRF